MAKPLVSILMPAYNSGRWIAQSLESALAQTWPHKEIIVVDDGSTDDTLAIARRYESKSVRVVAQANQGAAATRNRAFSLCSGDYIQWLDADDLLAAAKIESQMEALRQCGDARVIASGPWAWFFYRPDHARFVPTALWTDLSPVDWLVRKMELNLHMQTATWLVSRKVTEAAGVWNTRLVVDDDGEYFCRILLNCSRTAFVRDAKVFYRSSGGGSVSYMGRSSAKMEAQFHSMQLHIGYVTSLEDSERVRAACVRYLRTWLPEFYPERPDIVESAKRLAADLGGSLEPPRFSWKYGWLSRLAGPHTAKRAQVSARRVRWSIARSADRAWAQLERLGSRPTSREAIVRVAGVGR